MKILFLSCRYPFPPKDGRTIRTYNLIKALSLKHDISLIAFFNEGEEPEDLNVEKYCKLIGLISRAHPYLIKDLIAGLFGRVPFTIRNYYSKSMKRLIEKTLEEDNFDLIHVEDLFMLNYLLDRKCSEKVVLDRHNVDLALMRQYAKKEKSLMRKIYATLTTSKIIKYEKKYLSKADITLCCSDDDRKMIKTTNEFGNVVVIPNGVDVDFYQSINEAVESNTILFVGKMDYAPNIEGMSYFVRFIFPLIRKVIPDVELNIVGGKVTSKLKELGDVAGVNVLGFVDDIRSLYENASVVVVPLLSGSGTRLKVLEAMAMQKAVVSTSIGCEGIECDDEKNIFIADTPEEFADKVINLMKNESLKVEIACSGRSLVESKYSWSMISHEINSVYSHV